MSFSDSDFVGSIPALYNKYLVPMIFESYAADLTSRAARHAPRNILEIGAGSGVVTRAMTPRLLAEARYCVTDLNQPMLDFAQASQPPDARLTWQQADAGALPYADRTFDLVLCQFTAMFFPDRTACYREIRRVLKPGGWFLFNVWDKISENEFAELAERAVASVFPEDPPTFMSRIPHGYHDRQRIRSDVEAAGFVDVSVETISDTSRAASPLEVAMAYCQGTPMRNEIERRDATRLDAATEAVRAAVESRWGSGPVAARIQGHVIAAKG